MSFVYSNIDDCQCNRRLHPRKGSRINEKLTVGFFGGGRQCSSEGRTVITSYSIHYTKLYDSGAEAVEKDRARYSILADKFSKEVLSLETELAREVYQRDLAEAQEAAKLEEATLTAFSDSWDRARDALVAAVEVSASIPVDVSYNFV